MRLAVPTYTLAKEGVSMRWRSLVIVLAAGGGLLIPHSYASATTIAEAVERALAQHSELRQARLSFRLAELELDATLATFSLPTLTFQIQPPSLTLDGLSGDLRGSLAGSVSLPLGSSAQISGNLGLAWDIEDASWNLDGWSLKYIQRLDLSQPSGALARIEQGEAAILDSQAALGRTRNAVILGTIESYGQLLSGAAAVTQTERQLKRAEDELRSVESLAEEGLRGASSLTEARLDVLEAQIRMDKLRTSYDRDVEEFARETLGTTEPIELAPLDLALEALRADATKMIERSDLVDAAVEASASVLSAMRSIEDAKEELSNVLREVLPDVSLEAGYTNGVWAIGGTIGFDFFSPDRGDRIEIARTNLALAQERLAGTRSQQLNSLLGQQAALLDALRDLDRLALEEEKWALEEQVMTAKYEAATIGEGDWKEFVESKEAFALEARERETTLLLAYLRYRDALGLELKWEEWLQ
jgi:outer membrane protein TolC